MVDPTENDKILAKRRPGRPSILNNIHDRARYQQASMRIEGKILIEFDNVCAQNDTNRVHIITEAMKFYISKFARGAPQSRIEQFLDPQFMPTPALFAGLFIWKEYLAKNCSFRELEEIRKRAIMIEDLIKDALWAKYSSDEYH